MTLPSASRNPIVYCRLEEVKKQIRNINGVLLTYLLSAQELAIFEND